MKLLLLALAWLNLGLCSYLGSEPVLGNVFYLSLYLYLSLSISLYNPNKYVCKKTQKTNKQTCVQLQKKKKKQGKSCVYHHIAS